MSITSLLADGTLQQHDVPHEPCVIISTQLGDGARLGSIATEVGYKTFYTGVHWPRDVLLSYGDRTVFAGRHSELGTGGLFVFGNSFGIYGSSIFTKYREPSHDDDRHHFLRSDVRNLSDYLGCKLHEVDVWRTHNNDAEHIDASILPIPGKNLLLVEGAHYQKVRSKLEHISSAHNQEVVVVPTKNESAYFPLNCLVLDTTSGPFVVANAYTPRFLGVLNELRIDYATLRDFTSWSYGGSIRCRTNVVANQQMFLDAFTALLERTERRKKRSA